MSFMEPLELFVNISYSEL